VVLLIVLLLAFPSFSVFSQDKGTGSLGVLGEVNTNTRKGPSFAGGLSADYSFTSRFAAGLRADYGTDFHDVSAFEASVFGRYYFFTRPYIFVQLGAGYVRLFEDDRYANTVLADGSAGLRFPIRRFYAETYLRFGWPVGFGGGLVLGYRFVPKVPAPPPEEAPEMPPETPDLVPELPEAPPELSEVPDFPKEFFGDDFIETPDHNLLYIPEIFFRGYAVDFAGEEQDTAAMEHNRQVLENVSGFLTSHPDYTLLIVGYANPVLGTREEEETRLIPLSRSRAEFIKNELVRLGIDEFRISTFGSGGQGADVRDIQRNRRVQFHFINLGAPQEGP
jgi:outer membrane protein OmpA-like peptidoglycan-associated protein